MIERGQVTKAETVCDSITGWSPHCHSTSNSHSLLNAYPVLFTVLETSLSGWMLSLPLTFFGKRLKLLELPATSTHARGKMQVQSHTYI
ncbi:hypothetical protein B296_00055372 [Ensete ventricosum]|uniref:Uncharacterized protein n=1 Tax=Ensete ventricosum TaxID=4639 RepID=A0A426XMR9_ENSVE|nr:hypothetical protein B296_00055372 [Ensete ventricosum]